MAEESLRDLATVVFSAQARRLQAHYLFDLNFDYISAAPSTTAGRVATASAAVAAWPAVTSGCRICREDTNRGRVMVRILLPYL